jgi:phenylpropionate dioxygenase-like ring-hydroxylating dioxygenase large terminal subunit
MPVAQINVARFLRPKDDQANAAFHAALDHVNDQADRADGFIWRLVGNGNNATDLVVDAADPDFLVNISVWRDVAALESFAYRQADHRAVLARRREWFATIEPSLAMWFVPPGHVPSVDEGLAKLAALKADGPGKAAFTFGWYRENRFEPDL